MNIQLNDNHWMPARGFGTAGLIDWQNNSNNVTEIIISAIDIGYRHIDTSPIYGNEESIGLAIKNSIIDRENLYVVSKLPASHSGYADPKSTVESTLNKLQLNYLDLYLLHWPIPEKTRQAWKQLESLRKDQLIKSIGVSNFDISKLKDLLAIAEIKPVCNQIEVHPYFYPTEVINFCSANHIQIVGWSPLGAAQWKTELTNDACLQDSVIQKIANDHQATAAQIILRWHFQHGLVTIPKSSSNRRIRKNFEIDQINLSQNDMKLIDSLNRGIRFGTVPDWLLD